MKVGIVAAFDEQANKWAEFYEEYFDDPNAICIINKDKLFSMLADTDEDFDPVPWNALKYNL